MPEIVVKISFQKPVIFTFFQFQLHSDSSDTEDDPMTSFRKIA